MEDNAMGFTLKQYGIIEKIVQNHIRDWEEEESRDLKMKEQLAESEIQFQEVCLKSARSFNRAFRLSILVSSTVTAVCIIAYILFG